MKRGGTDKPFRPPPDGWPLHRFAGALYQHRNAALNGLPKFVNNTQVTLQPNQVGRPESRPTFDNGGPNSCESHPDNGLPKSGWIGVGPDQDLPVAMGGGLKNTFEQQGTNDLGLACRQRGFKIVQAYRQWHGMFGWLSEAVGCNNTRCTTEVIDRLGNEPGSAAGDPGQHTDGAGVPRDYYPTYSYSSYAPYRPAADQMKYLTLTSNISTSFYSRNFFRGNIDEFYSSASGAVTVDPLSGKRSSTLKTANDGYVTSLIADPANPSEQIQGPRLQWLHVDGGAGYVVSGYETPVTTYHPSGMTTILDGVAGSDVHCGDVKLAGEGAGGASYLDFSLYGYVAGWNEGIILLISIIGLEDTGINTFFPAISDLNHFEGTVTGTDANNKMLYTLSVSWHRTNTDFTWELNETLETGSGYDPAVDGSSPWTYEWSYSGSLSLSGENPASSVKGDVEGLLSRWALNDDAQYPWRTDGVWQVAPYVSREEAGGDVSPVGFVPYTVDDLRSPVGDVNGNAPFTSPYDPLPPYWFSGANNNDGNGRPPADAAYSGPAAWIPTYAQMRWFDPAAYAFKFPSGRDQSNSAASDWVQVALTGKMLGMPMPAAFVDSRSYWYDPGFSAPDKVDCQNFFDFRAEVWAACQYYNEGGDGPYVDFYIQGSGEWLYDAIRRTGAMLPHRATQWTNNLRAMMLPPYAYMIQADNQTYDKDGQPGAVTDFHTGPGGMLAQKCCEIVELWPAYNFFRPAGRDKFALDETKVWCLSNLSGDGESSVWSVRDAAGGTPADGTNFSALFGSASVSGFYSGNSYSSGTLTLGTKVYVVPSDWTLESGDIATAAGIVRFPGAPSLLGRVGIAAVTDVNGNAPGSHASDAGQHDDHGRAPGDPGFTTGTDYVPTYQFESAQTAFGLAMTGTEAVDIYDAGMSSLAGNVTATRLDDSRFTLGTAYSGAAWVMVHGAPAWYWDDNQRKGDFTNYSWLFDYRTNGEVGRLTGGTDCNGNPLSMPAANLGYAAFSQGQDAIRYEPCSPPVIAVTPNGETWKNSVAFAFPSAFTFDATYGARWQFEFEQAMGDLLWQAPHRPCSATDPLTDDETSGSNIIMEMDDGTCRASYTDDNGNLHFVYAHVPLVESRLAPPGNGGYGQNESAPSVPVPPGMGHVSPVDHADGLFPAGMIGYDPASGNPSAAWTFWGYRQTIEDNACGGGCRFTYVDAENLPCVQSYTPPAAAASLAANTTDGLTDEGLT